ncbi:GntR family transcriptional regulator [Rhizobium miluonense]|uniref:GntR family transcriptional regulator n=1 Tax=Rhizobium miluonense TaxID=411945 RepID=UPI0013566E73|nr:GntR family transcriptional regulator [Rhizobium miluonense]
MSLHSSIREELMRRIEQGVYPDDEPLPSAATLGREFGVSQITIKRSLRDLQAAGILMAQVGRGSFIKRRTRLLRKLGSTNPYADTQIEILSIALETVDDPILREMEPVDGPVLCVRKILMAEGRPFFHDVAFISKPVSEVIVAEFERYLVVEAFERAGIGVLKTDLIIEAAPADGEIAALLGVPTGYPLFRRYYRFTMSKTGLVVMGLVQAPFEQLACTINVPEPSEA